MKFFAYIILIISLFLGCFLHKNTSEGNCINSKDHKLNKSSGQYVVFTFYKDGKPITSFQKYNNRHMGYEFQYGKLMVYYNALFPPVNIAEFGFIYEKDTMNIVMPLEIKTNYFIDSISFENGKFNIILNNKDLKKDSLRQDFLDYYISTEKKVKPKNPYKNYTYCDVLKTVNEKKSAKNYIKDVLSEKFVKVRVKSIKKME